jgi:hypothetical protein
MEMDVRHHFNHIGPIGFDPCRTLRQSGRRQKERVTDQREKESGGAFVYQG